MSNWPKEEDLEVTEPTSDNPSPSKGLAKAVQPDIDDLLGRLYSDGVVYGHYTRNKKDKPNLLPSEPIIATAQALYQRLAAEAVYADVVQYGKNDKRVPFVVKAIPISKLKAIMEIK